MVVMLNHLFYQKNVKPCVIYLAETICYILLKSCVICPYVYLHVMLLFAAELTMEIRLGYSRYAAQFSGTVVDRKL